MGRLARLMMNIVLINLLFFTHVESIQPWKRIAHRSKGPSFLELQSRLSVTAGGLPSCEPVAAGMEDGSLAATAISVSSAKNFKKGGRCARLNSNCGGWVVEAPGDKAQWLQVDVGGSKFITGFIVQGHRKQDRYVKTFLVYTSDNGVDFRPYAPLGTSKPKKFAGLYSNTEPVKMLLERPVRARYIRFNPLTWHGDTISMRAEVLLCKNGENGPCAYKHGNCDALVSCKWPDTSVWDRSCGQCPDGFSGYGDRVCKDIDECATHNGMCDHRTKCTNTIGGRTCSDCPEGFTGNGADRGGCQDVNECLEGNGGCHRLRQCLNTPGGRECGSCPLGYVDDGNGGCDDIDECAINHGACDPLVECHNFKGGSACGNCPTGYSGSGENGCIDVDECLVENGGCDELVTCTNIPGSRTCGPCPEGYKGDPTVLCQLVAVAEAEKDKIDPEQFAKEVAAATAKVTAEKMAAQAALRLKRYKRTLHEEQELAKLDEYEHKVRNLQWQAKMGTLRRQQQDAAVREQEQQNTLDYADVLSTSIQREARREVQDIFDAQFAERVKLNGLASLVQASSSSTASAPPRHSVLHAKLRNANLSPEQKATFAQSEKAALGIISKAREEVRKFYAEQMPQILDAAAAGTATRASPPALPGAMVLAQESQHHAPEAPRAATHPPSAAVLDGDAPAAPQTPQQQHPRGPAPPTIFETPVARQRRAQPAAAATDALPPQRDGGEDDEQDEEDTSLEDYSDDEFQDEMYADDNGVDDGAPAQTDAAGYEGGADAIDGADAGTDADADAGAGADDDDEGMSEFMQEEVWDDV